MLFEGTLFTQGRFFDVRGTDQVDPDHAFTELLAPVAVLVLDVDRVHAFGVAGRKGASSQTCERRG